jgi:hypothetical protein
MLIIRSVPSSVMVNQSVGYDAGKKLKGRKRFTLIYIAMIRLMLLRLA